jgi:malonate decarboxylase epsilon subunit
VTLALLFPGQGSQRAGLLSELPETPAASQAKTEAMSALQSLDIDPTTLDRADSLRRTTEVQLTLLIAGVVTARALIEDHQLDVGTVAGHSIGAFAAAVSAGVLTVQEAVEVVHCRGQSMQKTAQHGRWGMAAVTGLNLRSTSDLAQRISTKSDPLWVANINAADEIVVSGTITALRKLRAQAGRAGARDVKPLDIAVASHCPLQRQTAAALADRLASVPRRRQQIAYITNAGGRRVLDGVEKVLNDLAQSVAQPVHWYDGVRLMSELGVRTTIETPPGHVLTHLVTRTAPDIHALSIDDSGLSETLTLARKRR